MRYPVHFIGKQYSIDSFRKEAEKYGVSRAMPLRVALGLEVGEKVILARNLSKCKSLVFGGFIISGFTPINLSPEEKEMFYSRLSIETTAEIDDEHRIVYRVCGSYLFVKVILIKDNMKDALLLLKEIKPDAKILVNGTYFDFEPFEHYPICFTRSITYTELPDFNKDMSKELDFTDFINAKVLEIENYIKGREK